MDKKILPFDCNVVYSMDCRISCRLGIIQTSQYAQAWLATHLDILMSENLDLNFGSGIYVNQMNYYDDILDTREIDLWESSPDQIVDILIDEINKDHYILIDLYWHDQFPDDINDPRTHSRTIIGYDINKRLFHTVALGNKKYELKDIPFDLFKKLYEDAIKQYLYDVGSKTLRQMFYFTITSISIRENISTDNYIFSAIVNKLGHEEGGAVIEVVRPRADKTIDSKTILYTGTYCILGVIKALQDNIVNQNFEDNTRFLYTIIRTLFGLAEHRQIILGGMKWIVDQLHCDDKTIKETISLYEIVPQTMQSLSFMIQKYYQKRDINIIHKVIDKLEKQFVYEKEVLKQFVDYSFSFYKNYNGYEEYKKRTH